MQMSISVHPRAIVVYLLLVFFMPILAYEFLYLPLKVKSTDLYTETYGQVIDTQPSPYGILPNSTAVLIQLQGTGETVKGFVSSGTLKKGLGNYPELFFTGNPSDRVVLKAQLPSDGEFLLMLCVIPLGFLLGVTGLVLSFRYHFGGPEQGQERQRIARSRELKNDALRNSTRVEIIALEFVGIAFLLWGLLYSVGQIQKFVAGELESIQLWKPMVLLFDVFGEIGLWLGVGLLGLVILLLTYDMIVRIHRNLAGYSTM